MEFNRFALAQKLGQLCCEKGLRIGIAESCTGGSLAEVITSVPGSSAWFDSSVAVYTNAAKTSYLGVDPKLFEQYGAVSEPVAKAMAQGVLKHRDVDFAIGITGLAGPGGGSVEKPVGTVCFALADKHTGSCEAKTEQFYSGRKHIRRCATSVALQWFLKYITTK